ncbi:P-loop NTPase family protein [Staphylococcus succinus]|uniref:hypothetical protein n=1 Tax=Staphylococcus succinus TaxID=61015 RepID=UPI002DBA5883|nr:hypothetical protein [Staphylococcus succinus]MEB8127701.1 hypothetical protein [Staphylococcus succinus]
MTNKMPRILLILAGPPGTGKTYMANQIKNLDTTWRLLSYDDIAIGENIKVDVTDYGEIDLASIREWIYSNC